MCVCFLQFFKTSLFFLSRMLAIFIHAATDSITCMNLYALALMPPPSLRPAKPPPHFFPIFSSSATSRAASCGLPSFFSDFFLLGNVQSSELRARRKHLLKSTLFRCSLNLAIKRTRRKHLFQTFHFTRLFLLFLELGNLLNCVGINCERNAFMTQIVLKKVMEDFGATNSSLRVIHRTL